MSSIVLWYTFERFYRNQSPACRVMYGGWWSGGFGGEELPVVLVVEDDQSLQSIVEESLTDGGFEPAIAPSGEEAVTLLKGGLTKYRALVTDINLSGTMSEWEVAKRAREIDPEFPIIYMTGASADEYMLRMAFPTASF
jgi:CheY-like chemotaxis protein